MLLPASRLAALVAAAALVLAGCSQPATTPSPSATTSASASASPSASPSATPSVKVSDNLDAISVKGAFGDKPTVTIKAPFAIDQTRVKVLVEGKGTKVPASGYVEALYSGSNGRTGKVFQEIFSTKKAVPMALAQTVAGFAKGLADQRIGSRVLIAMPGSEGYDPLGGSPEIGIQVGDTLVFVVDIVGGSVAGPTGKAITPKAGLPVVKDVNGKPTVAIPASNPPSSMVAQPLTEGTGATVKKDDSIVVHYLGVSWKTGKVVVDKYAAPDSGTLSSTIPGWQKGLVGKRIGQRVLLVLPPEDGYPQGSNDPPLEAGDTIVFVVDILFTTSEAA